MKKINWGLFLFGLIFFVVGVSVAFGGIMVKRSNDEFMKTAKTTEGIISDIETYREWDSDDDRYETKHRAYVTYEVNGQTFSHIKLSYYSSNMYEGKEITLYYDPVNPRKIKVDGEMTVSFIIMLILGGVFAIVGFIVMFASIRRTPKVKKLGKRYDAKVVNIECNTTVSVNGRHPYKVTCRVEDYGAGEAYIYKSKNVYLDLERYNLETVPVYVDPQKPSKFYVDVHEGVENMLNTVYSNDGSLDIGEFE